MQPHHIAICEKQSYLTASLEREFLQTTELTFRWLPYRDDFFVYLEENQCDIAIIECGNFSQDQLERISHLSKQTCLLAISPVNDFEFECLLRELGVASVLPQDTDSQRILQVFKRLLDASSISM